MIPQTMQYDIEILLFCLGDFKNMFVDKSRKQKSFHTERREHHYANHHRKIQLS